MSNTSLELVKWKRTCTVKVQLQQDPVCMFSHGQQLGTNAAFDLRRDYSRIGQDVPDRLLVPHSIQGRRAQTLEYD